jgi:spore coat polysaccharide biosynthesis protein SpsF
MNQKKIVAIIQARTGSTRLPYKMFLSLHGKPIIEWVIHRVRKSSLIDEMVVAIPDNYENDPLAALLNDLSVKIFRGPENDVLKRFHLVAREFKATHVVRICADNPLICGQAIDHLISFYFNYPCDYAYNHIPLNNTYPDGIGAEIVSFQLLDQLERVTSAKNHREHCLSYITDHPEQFNIKTFDPPDKMIAHPELKLDVDTFEDYTKLALEKISIDTSCEQIVNIFKNKTK